MLSSMAALADDLPVTIGMSLAEARTVLEAAQVAYDLRKDGGRLVFTHDDTPYKVDFDDDFAAFISARHPLTTFDEGLEIVRRHIASHGTPEQVLHAFTSRMSSEWFAWGWPALEIRLASSVGSPWFLHVTASSAGYLQRPSMMSLAEIREITAEVDACLGMVPIGEGERATAVARWGETVRARSRALARLAEVVESTAPAAQVRSTATHHLTEHARWLARHDDLFDRPDDHRDALYTVSSNAHHVASEGGQLGWSCQLAFEAGAGPTRHIWLARGPFVTGVCRVMRSVEELYPAPADDLNDAVTITQLPPEPPWRHRVEAVAGDVRVEVFGHDHVETLARGLAIARARAR